MNNFSKELIETIAALYSGEAMKGDPTEIKITGHVVWLAQQAKKVADAGNSKGNKFSDRLTNCRSRLLDGEAILNYLHKPENLNNLLEECSPEVTLAAMIDKAWHLVGEACGDTEHMCDTHDEEVKAEVQTIAREIHDTLQKPQTASPARYNQHLDTIDEIHEQTRSLLHMLMLNHRRASQGEEALSDSQLENYAWQLVNNMDRAIEASCALSESLK